MVKPKRSRNLIAYFLESALWKSYKFAITDNPSYWIEEDPERAERMYAASLLNMKGYKVEDYIFDMETCVEDSKLKASTRTTLMSELSDLYNMHKKAGTLMEDL